MKEAVKSFASISQIENILDIAAKNIEEIRNSRRLSYFHGRRCFDKNGLQSYLISQPISNTITMPTGDTETIIAWKSKGFLGF